VILLLPAHEANPLFTKSSLLTKAGNTLQIETINDVFLAASEQA
jgi:hypothetical protein